MIFKIEDKPIFIFFKAPTEVIPCTLGLLVEHVYII